jgi:hypothetical protein
MRSLASFPCRPSRANCWMISASSTRDTLFLYATRAAQRMPFEQLSYHYWPLGINQKTSLPATTPPRAPPRSPCSTRVTASVGSSICPEEDLNFLAQGNLCLPQGGRSSDISRKSTSSAFLSRHFFISNQSNFRVNAYRLIRL